jgi:hypothetical protein
MLAQCSQLVAYFQVFTESFNLVIRPAGSPCLAIRASEVRFRISLGKVAIQIGRIGCSQSFSTSPVLS